mmetsp:Transcript_24896/g.65352  ORF Transcript_24896/g.65352 Transcript_24896/m.65352 type:complete len:94 (-) Transcript_24896:196-477(-)
MSHYLADIHFNVASSRPRQVHIIRSIQTAALNVFFAEKFMSSRDIFKLAKHYRIPQNFRVPAGETARPPLAGVRPPPNTGFQMKQVQAEANCA